MHIAGRSYFLIIFNGLVFDVFSRVIISFKKLIAALMISYVCLFRYAVGLTSFKGTTTRAPAELIWSTVLCKEGIWGYCLDRLDSHIMHLNGVGDGLERNIGARFSTS